MARSVNMAIVIGNLTRDPEMRYTPAGHAVVSFGVATNRTWQTAEGEKKEEAEFHNVVAWNKLAEICNQYLSKGRQVYIQGRLQTRNWDAQDGSKRTRTEIIAEDMVILDRRGMGEEAKGGSTGGSANIQPKEERPSVSEEAPPAPEGSEDVNPKDMPF